MRSSTGVVGQGQCWLLCLGYVVAECVGDRTHVFSFNLQTSAVDQVASVVAGVLALVRPQSWVDVPGPGQRPDRCVEAERRQVRPDGRARIVDPAAGVRLDLQDAGRPGRVPSPATRPRRIARTSRPGWAATPPAARPRNPDSPSAPSPARPPVCLGRGCRPRSVGPECRLRGRRRWRVVRTAGATVRRDPSGRRWPPVASDSSVSRAALNAAANEAPRSHQKLPSPRCRQQVVGGEGRCSR